MSELFRATGLADHRLRVYTGWRPAELIVEVDDGINQWPAVRLGVEDVERLIEALQKWRQI